MELNSTHWRSEFFAREERIQWNYSCATIRISHKQFLAKYFAVVELGLKDFLVCSYANALDDKHFFSNAGNAIRGRDETRLFN